jgi:hypothetical protein
MLLCVTAAAVVTSADVIERYCEDVFKIVRYTILAFKFVYVWVSQ